MLVAPASGLTKAKRVPMAKANRKRTPKARRRRPSKKAPGVHALMAVDLAVGSPVIGAPSLRQAHVLRAVDLAIGSPAIGVIVQAGPTLSIKTGRRRALNSACVAQLQAQIEAHLRTAPSRMKQAAAVHLVRRWLQDSTLVVCPAIS